MTESTNAANPNRPAIHRVTKGPHKSATVTIVETSGPSGKHMQALARDVKTGDSYSVLLTSLERIFRTGEERELGRDFAAEEATAHEQRWELRFAVMAEERRRKEIAESIEQMAQHLERAAITLRNELASPSSDPAVKVERAQHELAWIFPNLGAHNLTHAAIEWSTARREITRLLTDGIEPA